MTSSVTSSNVMSASGIDVLVPYHVVATSSPLISSPSTPNLDARQRSLSLSSSGMTGLLSSRSLVQATDDEKLVVATLATLDSGSASTLIKQDLKLIIQSRRKAEGKEEIKVEFKKPIKDELTSEEVVKRMRRRELNRLAARRSREKGQKRKEKLVEEIKLLQSQNSKLVNDLTFLTDERDNIVNTLRHHMKQCSDYAATRTAAAGLPPRVLDRLGLLHEPPPSSTLTSHFSTTTTISSDDKTPSSLALSNLHIDTSLSNSSSSVIVIPQSPHVLQESTTAASTPTNAPLQSLSYSSCPPSPIILGVYAGQAPSPSPSITSSPFHFTPSSSSPSSSQITGQSFASAREEEMSQDSSASPFSPPLNSPRKSLTHSSHHHHHHRHHHHLHLHHSPRHESVVPSSPSSKIQLSTHAEIQDSEFARPTSVAAPPPTRFLLERSFSCPSSSSSNREHFHHESSPSLSSSPPTVLFESDDTPSSARDDSLSFSFSSESGSSSSKRVVSRHYSISEQEAPLDLVVRYSSDMLTDSDGYSSSLFSTDTWPRRSSGRLPMNRASVRRWSVDDQHSPHLREPLNLSTRSKE